MRKQKTKPKSVKLLPIISTVVVVLSIICLIINQFRIDSQLHKQKLVTQNIITEISGDIIKLTDGMTNSHKLDNVANYNFDDKYEEVFQMQVKWQKLQHELRISQ